MRDLKYGEVAFDRGYKQLKEIVKCEALQQPANAFVANLYRVETLIQMPFTLTFLSPIFPKCILAAVANVTGMAPAEAIDADEETKRAVRAEYFRLLKVEGDALDSLVIESAEAAFQVSKENIAWIARSHSRTFDGLEALLNAVILGTWTAFETLAGDLWEAALNAAPRTLSKLKGRKSGAESRTTKEEPGKSISLDELHRHGLDVRQTMGTLLRSKFAFTKLGEIRLAYEKAFSEHHNDVEAAINSQSLRTLSLVRNVIVHKAATADKEFLDGIQTIPLFAGLKQGERLALDGETVRKIVEPAIQASMDLVGAVDRWIGDHPEN
jgi:hypothetical protein